MPLISRSDCNPPAWLFNVHLPTMIPGTFRRVEQQREDNDFPMMFIAQKSPQSRHFFSVSASLNVD
jgi:hypothetical protein